LIIEIYVCAIVEGTRGDSCKQVPELCGKFANRFLSSGCYYIVLLVVAGITHSDYFDKLLFIPD